MALGSYFLKGGTCECLLTVFTLYNLALDSIFSRHLSQSLDQKG
jgi:hypothetical protein